MRPAWNLYTGRFLDQLRFDNEFQKHVRLAAVVFRPRCKCSRIHVSRVRSTFLKQTIHASSKNNFRSKWCCVCHVSGFSCFSFLRSSGFYFSVSVSVLSCLLRCVSVSLCFCVSVVTRVFFRPSSFSLHSNHDPSNSSAAPPGQVFPLCVKSLFWYFLCFQLFNKYSS